MDYKNKLLLAKEALDSGSYDKETIEYIFPELKESEDVKMLQEIKRYVKEQGDKPIYKTPSRETILAIWDLGNEWKELTGGSISTEYGTQLEYIQKHWEESEYYLRAKQNEQKSDMGISSTTKQKLRDSLNRALEQETAKSWNEFLDEQKSVDKVEPKFHVGEWIIFNENHNSVYQVERIDNCRYYLRHYLGGSFSVHFDNELIRAWTIQDAKDGDVLSYRDGQWIFIYKGIVTEDTFKYYALLSEKDITVNDAAFSLLTSCIIPATKEQRDKLEKVMHKAGYVFDFENKILKKVEPKFKVGDWITDGQVTCKVLSVTSKSYKLHLYDDDYCHFEIDVHSINKHYHLWTIQDAKEGDILVSKDNSEILIFRRIDSNTSFSSYYNIAGRGELGWCNDSFIPATKEQRYKLEKAMADSGYTFDFDKKEIKKIEQKTPEESLGIDSETYNKIVDECIHGKQEPEPNWTEEDKEKISMLIDLVESKEESMEVKIELSTWLKSLKNKVKSQSKQEWSEEDSYNKTWIVETLLGLDGDKMYSDTCKRMAKWLNSLENRYTWKPTDEQIGILWDAFCTLKHEGYKNLEAFQSVYNDIKKLRE